MGRRQTSNCPGTMGWNQTPARGDRKVSRKPGSPMQKIFIGHWRWLEAQGPSYKQQAASCKRQAASLTRDLYCVIGYSRRRKNESKRSN
jgi:hypothetical protein